MAQGEGFKHITVTAPEEEDVVILAGGSGEAAEPAGTGDGAAGGEGGQAQAPEAGKAGPGRGVGGEGVYRETTLDDLERQPMPLAQRIVVIAAVICIIGAVIYCFAFMR